jgi:hypothetical protein
LREGVGWAVSAQAKYFAPKQNQGRNLIKMRKIRPQADFFLNVPRSGTYRVGEADISYEIYRAEGISRAEGTKKHCSER